MKKLTSSTKKIIAATSMTIFTLATVFTASTAWFTVARKIDTQGNGFEVTSYDGLVENIYVYKQDKENEYNFGSSPQISYKVDENGNITKESGSMFTMDSYDGNLDSNSLICSLIVFKLNTNVAKTHEKGIKLVPMSRNSDMTGDDLTAFLTLDTKSLDTTSNSLSSIISFSYSNVMATLPNEMSFSDSDFVKKNDTKISESFLKEENSTWSYKASNVTGTLYENSSFTSIDETTSQSCYVCCVMEYNNENLDHIFSINIANKDIVNMDITDKVNYRQDFYLRIS